MSIFNGDLIIPIRSADGKLVARRVNPGVFSGDLVNLARTADNKVIAVGVKSMTSQDDIGWICRSADNKQIAVKSTITEEILPYEVYLANKEDYQEYFSGRPGTPSNPPGWPASGSPTDESTTWSAAIAASASSSQIVTASFDSWLKKLNLYEVDLNETEIGCPPGTYFSGAYQPPGQDWHYEWYDADIQQYHLKFRVTHTLANRAKFRVKIIPSIMRTEKAVFGGNNPSTNYTDLTLNVRNWDGSASWNTSGTLYAAYTNGNDTTFSDTYLTPIDTGDPTYKYIYLTILSVNENVPNTSGIGNTYDADDIGSCTAPYYYHATRTYTNARGEATILDEIDLFTIQNGGNVLDSNILIEAQY